MLDSLLNHWPLKLLAVGLAFAIWVSVTGEKRIVQDFDVPLVVRLPMTRTLTEDVPNTVTIRLRGTEGIMRRLDTFPLEVQLDLQETAPGESDVQLTPMHVSGVPRGVAVEFIDPDRLNLVVEKLERRELKVEPTFLGTPPAGYEFYSATVQPERVMVEGPTSEVELLVVLSTNPIRLDMRRQSFTVPVDAVPNAPHVRAVDPQPIQVSVFVDGSSVERTMEGLPVLLEGSQHVSVATPERVDVTISGPPSVLNSMQREQVRVSAAVGELTPAEAPQMVPVRVDLVGIPAPVLVHIKVHSTSSSSVAVLVSEGRLAS